MWVCVCIVFYSFFLGVGGIRSIKLHVHLNIKNTFPTVALSIHQPNGHDLNKIKLKSIQKENAYKYSLHKI